MKSLVHFAFRTAALMLVAGSLLQPTTVVAQVAPDAPPLAIVHKSFDAEDRFVVTARVPAGHRHAVLEATADTPALTWRPMLATALDGRAATVIFRLPRAARTRILVRVTAGEATTFPTPVLDDAALCTVFYSGGEPSERYKMALLGLANAHSMSLGHLPRLQRYQQVAAWAKTQPHVVDAVVHESGSAVMIELTDEDVVTLFAPPKPDAEAMAREFPPGSPPLPPRPVPDLQAISLVAPGGDPSSIAPPTGVTKGLPPVRRAICANFLEADFPTSVPKISGWLKDKGYLPEEYGLMDVPKFKSLFSQGNQVGVMFMHAHGFPYYFKGKTYYALSLAQVTQDLPENYDYEQMRQLGELKMGKEENSPLPPVYGFTRVFIRNHMKNAFAPHSVLVADSCYGGDDELGKAFNDMGVGAYVSWDWESGKRSNESVEKIFDRLLGTNDCAPKSVPPERPFSFPVVQAWMLDKGYYVDPTFIGDPIRTPAKLKFHLHPTAPAYILRPSIRSLDYDNSPTATRLLLTGNFGKDPGEANRTVTWGGREMHVANWHEDLGISIDQLSVPLPVGDFEVKIRTHHASNPTPMTEWTLPLNYNVKGKGSLEYDINAVYKLRFDVHGVREKPEGGVGLPLVPFLNHADLTGTAIAKGRFEEPFGPDVSGFTLYQWSGNRTLKSFDQGGTGFPQNVIFCSALLNTQTGVPSPFFINCSSLLDLSVNGGSPVELSISYDSLTGTMTPIKFDPQDGWRVKGGTYTGMAPSFQHAVSSSMTWPPVTPAAVPTDETPR